VALVDAVVVSYNSASTIRACVEPLAAADWVDVVVVDNASENDALHAVADLEVTTVPLESNCGFAFGCNRGWELGSAPHVLFLNPDARLQADGLRSLVQTLDEIPSAGLVAPRIVDAGDGLEYSQRRFARLRSTYAQAFFLHRVLPRAAWTDQLVRDPLAYQTRHEVEWVSGACMLVRRRALEEIGGWDEDFFLYGEDQDLCHRLRSAGYGVFFEPGAEAVHVGGASAPRAGLLPVLAASRIRFATKHRGRFGVAAERLGIGLGALTHALLTTKPRAWRAGYLRAMRVALLPSNGSSRSVRSSLTQ
jgi:N-acetylglucosaminyl-diphospho-decaprenol L-rhamnosyltransferase